MHFSVATGLVAKEKSINFFGSDRAIFVGLCVCMYRSIAEAGNSEHDKIIGRVNKYPNNGGTSLVIKYYTLWIIKEILRRLRWWIFMTSFEYR